MTTFFKNYAGDLDPEDMTDEERRIVTLLDEDGDWMGITSDDYQEIPIVAAWNEHGQYLAAWTLVENTEQHNVARAFQKVQQWADHKEREILRENASEVTHMLCLIITAPTGILDLSDWDLVWYPPMEGVE